MHADTTLPSHRRSLRTVARRLLGAGMVAGGIALTVGVGAATAGTATISADAQCHDDGSWAVQWSIPWHAPEWVNGFELTVVDANGVQGLSLSYSGITTANGTSSGSGFASGQVPANVDQVSITLRPDFQEIHPDITYHHVGVSLTSTVTRPEGCVAATTTTAAEQTTTTAAEQTTTTAAEQTTTTASEQEAPTTTAASTTTQETTTTAGEQAGPTTTGPSTEATTAATLPHTGPGSGAAPLAALGAALTLSGIVLVLVRRRPVTD